MTHSNSRRLLLILLLLSGTLLLFFVLSGDQFEGIGASSGDLLPFWAAGRLVLEGKNPYDQALLFSELQTVYPAAEKLLPVYNPPWVMTLLVLFGGLPFSIFSKLWFVLSAILIASSCKIIWDNLLAIFNRAESRPTFEALLILITFFPIYQALVLGQLVPLVFCALTILLVKFSNQRSFRSIIAGSCLAVTLIKPHLFIITYIYVGFLVIRNFNKRFMLGLLGTFLCFAFLPLLWLPDIYQHYLQYLEVGLPLQWKNPTLGAWLLIWFGEDKSWLRFLQLVMGSIIYLVWLLLRGRPKLSLGALYTTLPLSLALSPYLWIYDFIFILPYLLFLIVDESDTEKKYNRGGRITLISLWIIGCNTLLWVMPDEMHYCAWYPAAILMAKVFSKKGGR